MPKPIPESPRPSATQVELRILAQLVRSESPLSPVELMNGADLMPGSIYPVIHKLAAWGIIGYNREAKPPEVQIQHTKEAWGYAITQLGLVQVFPEPLYRLNTFRASLDQH